MNPLFDTPPIPVMTAMSTFDANIAFTWDFSDVLSPGDTISQVTDVVADPNDLTVGTGIVVSGAAGPALGVQARLGPGSLGSTYTVTAKIMTTSGIPFARSLIVAVALR